MGSYKLPINFSRDFIIIDYPGVVENVETSFKSLGGKEKLLKALAKDPGSSVALRFNSQDEYSSAVYATPEKAAKYLIKIKRLKRKSSKGIEYKLKVEILGKIPCLYEFTSMADFSYLPYTKDPVEQNIYIDLSQNLLPPDIMDKNWFTHCLNHPLMFSNSEILKNPQENPAPFFFTPCPFSYTQKPVKNIFIDNSFSALAYSSRPDSKPAKNLDNEMDIHTTNLSSSNLLKQLVPAMSITFYQPSPKGLEPELRSKLLSLAKQEYVSKIQQLFEQEPILTKKWVFANCPVKAHIQRLYLSLISYYFATGPWKNLYVRYGFDPRQDPSARKYQSVIVSNLKSHCVNVKDLVCQEQSFTIEDSAFPPKEGTLPPLRQMLYRLCDIVDEEVQELVAADPSSTCSARDGWLSMSDYSMRINEILRKNYPHCFLTDVANSHQRILHDEE